MALSIAKIFRNIHFYRVFTSFYSVLGVMFYMNTGFLINQENLKKSCASISKISIIKDYS